MSVQFPIGRPTRSWRVTLSKNWASLTLIVLISGFGGRVWTFIDALQAQQTLLEVQGEAVVEALDRQTTGFQYVVCGQQLQREGIDPVYCEFIVAGDTSFQRMLIEARRISGDARARAIQAQRPPARR